MTLGEHRLSYKPALRFDALAWAYDPLAMRIVRAPTWRPALVDVIAPVPGQRILDLGCGTGSLCLLVKARCPEAVIIGIDPDPAILLRARRKAEAAGWELPLIRASATALPTEPPLDQAMDVCVASLMLHHLKRSEKQVALAEAVRMLKPGGRFLIADWGPPRTRSGRLGFFITQLFDGFETTRDHATGAFLDLVSAAGLNLVFELGRWPTPVGVLCLYSARKSDAVDADKHASATGSGASRLGQRPGSIPEVGFRSPGDRLPFSPAAASSTVAARTY
jgi:ubiquinone/menaquinone biosynthesis C-methylase UbiE